MEDDLAAGRLVAPLELEVRTEGAYYLTYAADRPKPPRLAAFEDWVIREAVAAEANRS